MKTNKIGRLGLCAALLAAGGLRAEEEGWSFERRQVVPSGGWPVEVTYVTKAPPNAAALTVPATCTIGGHQYDVEGLDGGLFGASLTRLELPPALGFIDDAAFSGCTALKDIKYHAGGLAAVSNALARAAGVTAADVRHEVVVQWHAEGEVLTGADRIGGAVTLPDEVDGTKVTTVGKSAFGPSYATPTSLVIPDSITAISNRAFRSSPSLASVTFGAGIRTIEPGLFTNCTVLTDVTVPNAAVEATVRAALLASGLDAVKVTVASPKPALSASSARTTRLRPAAEGPAWTFGTQTVYDGFGWPIEVTSATAVSGAAGAVSVPERSGDRDVERLGEGLFAGNAALTSLWLPPAIGYIATNAFEGCTALKAVTCHAGAAAAVRAAVQAANLAGVAVTVVTQWHYELGDGYAVLTGADALAGEAVLPDTLAGQPVTTVGCRAFGPRYSDVTALTVPESVTDILAYAFRHNVHLATLKVGEKLARVADGAFRGCTNLASVTARSASALGVVSNALANAGLDCAAIAFAVEPAALPKVAASSVVSTRFEGFTLQDDAGKAFEVEKAWFVEQGWVAPDAEPAAFVAAAQADADGDGLANWAEYVCGTDPKDATQKIVATIEIVDGQPVVSFEPGSLRPGYRAVYLGSIDLRAWTEVDPANLKGYNYFKVGVVVE